MWKCGCLFLFCTIIQLHLHPHVEEAKEEKEEDFFTEHEQFTSADVEPVTLVVSIF